MIGSPETILLTIKALARLGSAARKVYEDAVIGEDIVLPGLDLEPIEASKKAAGRIHNALIGDELALPQSELSKLKADVDLIIGGNKSTEGIYEAGLRVIDQSQRFFPELELESTSTGIYILKQWSPRGQPAIPLHRIGLAIIEVGLEYVAVNPGKIGLGGNADQLIAGIAANLSDLLPDPNDFRKPGNDFAEGAIRIFVQAGLTALNENVDDIVEKDSISELSKAILKPLIQKVATGGSGISRWYDIRDELLGPIAEAAIGTLAKHQTELLGEKFGPETGIGAVTTSVLLAIKENGLVDDFGREGTLRIYRAALDVAVKQPELFVGETNVNGKQVNIGQELLVDAANVLNQKSPPFNRDLAIELVTTSIETVGRNAPTLFTYEGEWGKLSTEAIQTAIREISTGLAAGVKGQRVDIFTRLFNKQQAKRFFKIFLDQVAANPELITGSNKAPELQMLTTIVALTMAEKNKILLSSEDWLVVAASIAEEVAKNPGRLIKLDEAAPESQLAYKIISALLKAAAVDFEQVGRSGGSVLFGTTLTEAISDSIKAAAGNAVKALENTAALGVLVDRLNSLNRAQPGSLGYREWRFLFRRFVADVLDTGKVPEYSNEQLIAFLLADRKTTSTTDGETIQ